MQDRELLELAAKAAGIGPLDFDYTSREKHSFYFGPRLPIQEGVLVAARHRYWHPLADDGDALRLAVSLGIRIAPEANGGDVAAASATRDFIGQVSVEVHGNDRYAATRRAIVRCAADIGKAMP